MLWTCAYQLSVKVFADSRVPAYQDWVPAYQDWVPAYQVFNRVPGAADSKIRVKAYIRLCLLRVKAYIHTYDKQRLTHLKSE